MSTRALQVQLAQEYPQMDSFSVLWYTDAGSRSTLQAARRALLPERTILIVAPPAMLGNKVCKGFCLRIRVNYLLVKAIHFSF